MRFLTFFTSVVLVSSSYVNAQKCKTYNVLTLPATFRDVCVSGTCMSSTTFIPDFDFPNDIEGRRAYQETSRNVNGYVQNYCGALGPFSSGLFPQGCTACDQKACDYSAVDGLARRQVETALGSDGTPIFRNANKDTLDRTTGTGIKSITSADSFYKWYHDTPATKRIDSTIILQRQQHTQTFSMQLPYFFPLDTRGWQDTQEANDHQQHNFGFTTRIFSEFVYTGGETFTFQGDDDVWVFIDNKLAIDIGGIHPGICRAILLDEAVNNGVGKVYECTLNPNTIGAARAGETYTIPNLTKGSTHTLHIFHAERHRDASTFAMSTSIGFNAGETGGLDYTLPSATGARIYIGTYEFIALGQVDSAPDPIQLPIYTGTPFNTAITITLEFPPTDQTQIICRILKLNSTIITAMKLDTVDRNTIPSPLDITAVKAAGNQATWASVITEADHVATSCTANENDLPSWTITVRTTGGGSGYLYCIADSPGVSYSDYTADGKARDTTFYRKWVATSISSQAPTTPAPTTIPPTTIAPTTVAPTTLAPTTPAPTTLPPTTPAPTTLPPSTAAPTTLAPTTEAPTTLAPTTATPTTLPPVITTQPPTTEAPTDAPTTQTPTTQTPTTATPTTQTPTTETPTTQAPTTQTPTTQTPSTQAPTTEAPTTQAPTTQAPTDATTTAPPTSTSTPTSVETTNPPTSTSEPTVTVAPTDASTPTPVVNSTSTSAPITNATDVPTFTPTFIPGNDSSSTGSESNNGTTSMPTSPVTEAPITEAPPTDEPTEAPVESGSGVASAAATSGMSLTTRLAIIIPAAVGGLIVVLLAVWAVHYCIKRHENAVINTRRTSMEMV